MPTLSLFDVLLLALSTWHLTVKAAAAASRLEPHDRPDFRRPTNPRPPEAMYSSSRISTSEPSQRFTGSASAPGPQRPRLLKLIRCLWPLLRHLRRGGSKLWALCFCSPMLQNLPLKGRSPAPHHRQTLPRAARGCESTPSCELVLPGWMAHRDVIVAQCHLASLDLTFVSYLPPNSSPRSQPRK